MKFICKCGVKISDSSINSAHLMPTKNWDRFWDDVDDAIEKSGPSPRAKEKACMRLRTNHRFLWLFQCHDCGRLLLFDKNQNIHFFEPDDDAASFGLLGAN